jgi:hypothetical protein
MLDILTTAVEAAAVLAFAVALIWAAALVPGPWAGPAVAAATGLSLLASSAVLLLIARARPR